LNSKLLFEAPSNSKNPNSSKAVLFADKPRSKRIKF
jgi:hypothetical protein